MTVPILCVSRDDTEHIVTLEQAWDATPIFRVVVVAICKVDDGTAFMTPLFTVLDTALQLDLELDFEV